MRRWLALRLFPEFLVPGGIAFRSPMYTPAHKSHDAAHFPDVLV
jgi:hypothetical protein